MAIVVYPVWFREMTISVEVEDEHFNDGFQVGFHRDDDDGRRTLANTTGGVKKKSPFHILSLAPSLCFCIPISILEGRKKKVFLSFSFL